MRGIDYFDADNLEDQRLAHYPGDFGPYKQSIIEHWKRTVAVLFKIDTYMSLLSHKEPQLNTYELKVPVTSSFTLWNAYGMDVWFQRQRKEPERTLHMSAFSLKNIQSLGSEGLLVEDTHIGLCSLYNDIWKRQQGQLDSASSFITPCRLSAEVVEQAEHDLKIINDTNASDEDTLKLKQLLTLYLTRPAENDTDDWKTAASQVQGHISESIMLCHVLHLCIFADIQAMNLNVDRVNGLLSSYRSNLASTHEVSARLQRWAEMPADGPATRTAKDIVGLPELKLEGDSKRVRPDPLTDFAIVMSALVIFTWLTHTQRPCICAEQTPSSQYGDIPLCVCATDLWVVRFEALAATCDRQDMSKRIAEILNLGRALGAQVGAAEAVAEAFT